MKPPLDVAAIRELAKWLRAPVWGNKQRDIDVRAADALDSLLAEREALTGKAGRRRCRRGGGGR